jgi:hypothetical protein
MSEANSNHISEIWKQVVGYEGFYSVSSLGRIRRESTACGTHAGKILKGVLNKETGYYRVDLSVKGHRKLHAVHRLVVLAFIGDIADGYVVNHKSGIKSDNRVTNLEVVTIKQNAEHASQNGLLRALVGQDHPFAKLTDLQVLEIRKRYDCRVVTHKMLAFEFGVTRESIRDIVNRKKWSHI